MHFIPWQNLNIASFGTCKTVPMLFLSYSQLESVTCGADSTDMGGSVQSYRYWAGFLFSPSTFLPVNHQSCPPVIPHPSLSSSLPAVECALLYIDLPLPSKSSIIWESKEAEQVCFSSSSCFHYQALYTYIHRSIGQQTETTTYMEFLSSEFVK